MKGLARLGESLREHFEGDFLGFIGESSVGAPLHTENPYAFKVFAIARAIELGYTEILWLDTSVVAVANLEPVFKEIAENGYIMQEAGWMVGRWCNDFTLEYFGTNRETAMQMPMYGNAGLLGLNFNSQIACSFFKRWVESMENNCFKGSWDNHRHDMSAGSIIANKLGMKYKKGDELLEYAAPGSKPKNNTIIFQAEGM